MVSVRYCIVCEDGRWEAGNKVTLAGFFGLIPGVEMLLATLSKPVSLSLVFGTTPGSFDEKFPFYVEVLNPDGTSLTRTQVAEMQTAVGRPALVAVSVTTKFFTTGLHKVKLFIDNEKRFEGDLSIKSMSPDQMGGGVPQTHESVHFSG
jgi:hypothetical protein